MIYVTGTRYNSTAASLEKIRKPSGELLNSNDTLIIVGGFDVEGFLVNMHEELDKIEKQIPYTIICLSGASYFGNSEKYTNIKRFGGTVKHIRNNVFQLYGGSAYQIEGKKLFVFHGAVSKGDSEYDRGVKCLEDNNYSFDYILSNRSMQSTLVYFIRGIRSIDLSGQCYLDKHLINCDFKLYIFGRGPSGCSLTKEVHEEVFELK